MFIINLFSTSEDSGEDIIGTLICGFMQSRKLNTKFICYDKDFDTASTQYLLARSVTDFYTLQGEDVLIVAYPPLSKSSISSALLHDANANILVTPADRGWKMIDKQLCEQLMLQLGKSSVPFRICLTNASREAAEDFTGQLPAIYPVAQDQLSFQPVVIDRKDHIQSSEEKQRKQKTRTRRIGTLLSISACRTIRANSQVSMLVNVKTGLFSMVLILLLTTVCLIQLSNDKSTEWKRGQNLMTWLFIVWLLYYLMEIMNPNNVLEAWNINITPYVLIPLICAFVVPVVIRTKKDIELLLIVWSVFVIIFTLKGYWQKNHGFSAKDLYFLYALGGARTHIIWSGIRYFSCFSDAANYGVHAAMAAVTFAIASFFTASRWMRFYFLFVALCGIYGMGISGTRSAMGVLMGGMLMITIIAKNWKALLGGIFISISVFVFFYYTNIGSGNQYIYKMRSSFHPTEDASYLVRVENRQRMKELMARKPIGYGIGLSKAGNFNSKEQMPYPPDSWLVAVWVEPA